MCDTFGKSGRYRTFGRPGGARVCLELGPGFVRLFYGEWEPYVNEDSKESVDLDEELGPLEGCTQEDVGWMRVSYGEVHGIGGQSGVCIQPPESNWRLYANITE